MFLVVCGERFTLKRKPTTEAIAELALLIQNAGNVRVDELDAPILVANYETGKILPNNLESMILFKAGPRIRAWVCSCHFSAGWATKALSDAGIEAMLAELES
jgi:hypothetical protein